MAETLLEIKDLTVGFDTDRGRLTAVDGISFAVERGETLGLVGESGCGKSVTAMSILRLLLPPATIAGGEILFQGKDLLKLPEREMRRVRGNDIAMIFQEPMTSLNPVLTAGDQIAEVVRIHEKGTRREAWRRAVEMLELVAIPDPAQRAREYPHQMSGGMRQRVMIAMALVCKPRLLVADEPTTALDVTIQAQILELLDRLKSEMDLSILLITHDLGVVAETCRRVVVMYTGQVVETATVADLFARPAHPYTEGLLGSIPNPKREIATGVRQRLRPILGMVPGLSNLPAGCRFRPRCLYAFEPCSEPVPLFDVPGAPQGGDGRDGHASRCFLNDPRFAATAPKLSPHGPVANEGAA